MKFSGYYLYMNSNIWGDFQICISVPLSKSVCRASEPMETLMLYIFPQKLLRIWNSMVRKKIRMMRNLLTLSWQKPLSYRNKSLIYSTIQWSGFYMIGTSVMKELICLIPIWAELICASLTRVTLHDLIVLLYCFTLHDLILTLRYSL